ncbi:DUF736 domain-containing protein [Novosphingobium sp. Fuku2-ISO-50]|uniref:DUF736 domain-containing protein n=1 Tax=Novosphingobium sp. Fuku2-ISO-50 TaxID=1739114 RepID=UPI00076BC8E6|nr:DUF736 domain-containing protein [Novosphingobium sp. Fuku2-ISO-50]KUR75294.1 hypothetical protein AQZ50_15640 [Novosphingobium sp. Fuku2-ISO-50]
MNIGQLKPNAAGVFLGKIQTATLDLTIGLRSVESRNPAVPKFDVMVRSRSGQFLSIGGLWEKTANNGAGTFLQGQIDDPSFEAPLSIALFAQNDGSLNVAWSRPRRRMGRGFGELGAQDAANDTFDTDEGGFGVAFASDKSGPAAAA